MGLSPLAWHNTKGKEENLGLEKSAVFGVSLKIWE